MANVNAPFGFVPWTGTLGGVAPTHSLVERRIAAGDAVAIGKGDPVKNLATGYVARWTAAIEASQLAGIFWGCKYLSISQGKMVWSDWWPGSDASGDVIATLIPCSMTVPPMFLVQSSGAPITFADIGANADVTMGTVNTVTHRSGASLTQGSLAVTATLPFRVMGIYAHNAPPTANGADVTSNFNWAIVAANVSGAGATGIV